jgi:sulfite exporter TauE/SafE
MQGLLLGLASGTTCVAYCAPVLVPFLLGEGLKIRGSLLELAKFLLGRAVGYLAFGFLAWLFHEVILNKTNFRHIGLGSVYILLSVLLALFGLEARHPQCGVRLVHRVADILPSWGKWIFPFVLGFLTGLNLCPPFLLAFAAATDSGSLGHSLLFFLMFYLGTSLFFLPIPLVSFFGRLQLFKTVGRMAAIVVAVYYFYSGIIHLGGGLIAL